jgi:hypothetical protein
MKKMMFLMLTLLIWGAASMNAQVTIGSENPPHSGAVLDLQSTTHGLKLPTVSLGSLTTFGLSLSGTSTVANAKGMYVYNTNPTIGEGVYVWDGYRWLLVKGSIGAKPVTSISISSTTGVLYVNVRKTIQLAALVTPSDANDPNVTWEQDYATGAVSITANGLVTGVSVGKTYIRARAANGVSSKPIAVLVLPETLQIDSATIGNNKYPVYKFGDDTWMLANSKEGTPTCRNFDGDETKNNSYYFTNVQAYTSDQSATPCPDPWHVPSIYEYWVLKHYLDDSPVNADKYALMINPYNIGGYYDTRWQGYGTYQWSWLGDDSSMLLSDDQPLFEKWGGNDLLPVRCVKNRE